MFRALCYPREEKIYMHTVCAFVTNSISVDQFPIFPGDSTLRPCNNSQPVPITIWMNWKGMKHHFSGLESEEQCI